MSTTFDYTLTRTLDASADAVWQAWTTPAQYAQWASAEDVVMDVRPGGRWSSVMVIPGGVRVPLTGTYPEVVENERLVVGMDVPGRDDPALMTVELAAEGDRTHITLFQALDTAEARDQSEAGSTMLLDSLTAFLARQ